MARNLTIVGALSAGLSVAVGAFAAHGLEDRLPPDRIELIEVAARYQMYHSLALLGCAALSASLARGPVRWAGWLFGVGILLFSGSLYALAFSGVRQLGMITPIGGLAFLAGWAALAIAGWRGSAANVRPRADGEKQEGVA